jgi:hypothetical protein
VYGARNTYKLANVVVARRLMSGMRHTINWNAAAQLRALIVQGRALINASGW